MATNVSNFVDWLNQMMREKNITQADIGHTDIVTPVAVRKLFTNQLKSVGVDMCRAISAATGIPLVIVFEKAGLLPTPNTHLSPKQRQLIELVIQADNDDVEMAIAMLAAASEGKKHLVPAAEKRKDAK